MTPITPIHHWLRRLRPKSLALQQPDSNKRQLPFESPLAWSQLSHQKSRLWVAMGGIAFANVLIFMQLGFRALFTEGATLIAENLRGDVFVLGIQTEALGDDNFDKVHLYRVAAIEGVQSVHPVYIQYARWTYSDEFSTSAGQVFAFNPQQPIFNLPDVNQQLWKLQQPNAVLVDIQSKPDRFGPIEQHYTTEGSLSGLLNHQRVEGVGVFRLGSSFFRSDGNIITSETNYQRLFGAKALDQVAVGVIRLEPGSHPQAIQAAIATHIPTLKALTSEELIALDLAIGNQNPAGAIFAFGAVMGFIVGVVLVYQVLYSDITDHLPEYATLKAMGFSDRTLLIVIFQEALILGVLGFVPGFGVSVWMYQFLAGLTRLQLVMQANIVLIVFALTLLMCLVSAAIASNQLRSADPADVFA